MEAYKFYPSGDIEEEAVESWVSLALNKSLIWDKQRGVSHTYPKHILRDEYIQ